MHPIHTRKHSFRTDRNTDTSISNAVNYIETHIHCGLHVLAVFLDIPGVCDTIDRKQVIQALLLQGGDPTLVRSYNIYLTYIHIEIKESQSKLSTSTGFPQGGTCSAKFWIVALNEAIQILNRYTRGTWKRICR